MSHPIILSAMDGLVGKKVNDFIDDIEKVADMYGYAVNVMDPTYNTCAIDEDPKRLNVRTKDGVITSFTIG